MYQDEFTLVLQFLKDAARWLKEKQIDYWQSWLNPPVEFVNWIKEGFEDKEFYLICQATETIGCSDYNGQMNFSGEIEKRLQAMFTRSQQHAT